MIKLDYQYVNEFFEKHGCKLLEENYQNAKTVLKYQCQCNEVSFIRFDDFKKGNRCKSCGIKKRSKTQTNSIQDVKSCFEKAKYVLLEEDYVTTNTKLLCKCPAGHEIKISYHNFQKGRRCRKCINIRRSGPGNHHWNPDRESVRLLKLISGKSHTALYETLKSLGKKKNNKTALLLGYTVHELTNHIKNHPNWNKVCNKKWHLDHIFPIKAFVDFGITDIKLINSLDNLQPLSEKDNLLKSDNYDPTIFQQWLYKKK